VKRYFAVNQNVNVNRKSNNSYEVALSDVIHILQSMKISFNPNTVFIDINGKANFPDTSDAETDKSALWFKISQDKSRHSISCQSYCHNFFGQGYIINLTLEPKEGATNPQYLFQRSLH
jgi:hypothetical protein